MPRLTLRSLTATYFRLGNTTFGGGDPMIMALQRELVDARRVLTPDQFAMTYSLSRATPGTNILAFCAGTGWQLRGWIGAIIAVCVVAIPSSIICVLVSRAYESWIANPFGRAAVNATLAAAVGLMFGGAWRLVKPHMTGWKIPRTTAIVAASFAMAWWSAFSPLKIVAIAALAGLLWPEPASK